MPSKEFRINKQVSLLQKSKKSPLPWWERVRERGKVAEISNFFSFHPPPRPPPIEGGGVFFRTFARGSSGKIMTRRENHMIKSNGGVSAVRISLRAGTGIIVHRRKESL
jgi:hypothetical protein